MSVENKIDTGKKIPDIKKLLEKKDIEGALSGLYEVSKNTLKNKQEELVWCLEIAEFTSQFNEIETNWVQSILAQFLTLQNLQS